MNERYEVRVSPRDENCFIVFDNETGENAAFKDRSVQVTYGSSEGAALDAGRLRLMAAIKEEES